MISSLKCHLLVRGSSQHLQLLDLQQEFRSVSVRQQIVGDRPRETVLVFANPSPNSVLVENFLSLRIRLLSCHGVSPISE